MASSNQGGSTKWWLPAVIAPIVTGLLIFWLTHLGGPLNAKPAYAELGGSIANVQMDTGSPCCTFAVKVQLKGFKNKTCPVRWFLVDSTGQRYNGSEETDFIPDRDIDEGVGEAAVSVNLPGTYYVTFELSDPNGVVLDRKNSDNFVVG